MCWRFENCSGFWPFWFFSQAYFLLCSQYCMYCVWVMQKMVFSEHWAGKVLCLMLCTCSLFPPLIHYAAHDQTIPHAPFYLSPCYISFHFLMSVSLHFQGGSDTSASTMSCMVREKTSSSQTLTPRYFRQASLHWNSLRKNGLSLLCYFLNVVQPPSWRVFCFCASILQLKLRHDYCFAKNLSESPLYSASRILWIVPSPSTLFQCVGSQIPF